MNWMRRAFGRQRIYGDLSEEIRAHLLATAVASGLRRAIWSVDSGRSAHPLDGPNHFHIARADSGRF